MNVFSKLFFGKGNWSKDQIVEEAATVLCISKEQARMRIDAFLESGLLERYRFSNEKDPVLMLVVDVAMSIPQLNETKS